jgi:hydroxyacylglutathione hydrolase
MRWDHEAMVAPTGARLLAHFRADARIAVVNRGAKAGDIIKVGKQVEPDCTDTPAHTM